MEDIRLDDDTEFRQPARVEQKPLFVRLILATNIVSSDAQAQYVLLGIACVGILFTLFMLFSGRGETRPTVPSITGMPVETAI